MRKSTMLALLLVCSLAWSEALAVAAPLQQSTPQQYPSNPPEQTTPPPAQTMPPLPQSDPALGAQPAQTTDARGHEVASGTSILTTLDTRLSTQATRVGERFTATVSQPVNAADGSVGIPAGAKVVGEVTEVERGKTMGTVTGNKARLNMRFTEIQLPNGSTVPITATLVSVRNTSKTSGAKTGQEGEVQGGTSGARAAKDIGIGAAVGTVAGLIFGSALKGLAIGAIAGGGYVLATGGKDVVLPEQTGLELRVDRNLAVPTTTP